MNNNYNYGTYGTVAQDQGYVKETGNGLNTKAKQVVVYPVTGDKTTQITRTRVERNRSSSSSSSS